MHRLFSLLLLAGVLSAQTASIRWSGTTGDVTTTASVVTIQQPTSAAKSVTLESCVVYCANACVITQAQNGTAASATAGTLRALTNTSGSIVTKFWTASNVGGGTAVAGTFHLAAGSTVVLDLTKISLPKSNSGAVNYSVTATSASGVTNITMYGSEQ